mmetsp:Transcript_3573/g.5580  ORF Transcript_3573/g.5580 Transcript_3573/m.5580 type:complete len:322 (-) Transcript_3573:149-1114(-)
MFPCQEAADRATIFNDGFSILQNLEQWRPKYLGQFTTEQEMLWAPGFATPLKEMRVNYVSSWTNNVCNFRKKRPHKEPDADHKVGLLFIPGPLTFEIRFAGLKAVLDALVHCQSHGPLQHLGPVVDSNHLPASCCQIHGIPPATTPQVYGKRSPILCRAGILVALNAQGMFTFRLLGGRVSTKVIKLVGRQRVNEDTAAWGSAACGLQKLLQHRGGVPDPGRFGTCTYKVGSTVRQIVPESRGFKHHVIDATLRGGQNLHCLASMMLSIGKDTQPTNTRTRRQFIFPSLQLLHWDVGGASNVPHTKAGPISHIQQASAMLV